MPLSPCEDAAVRRALARLAESDDATVRRRAFGQRLLDSGNRIEDVSVAMGHSSTKTTEGYYARNSENQVIKRILRNQTNNRR